MNLMKPIFTQQISQSVWILLVHCPRENILSIVSSVFMEDMWPIIGEMATI